MTTQPEPSQPAQHESDFRGDSPLHTVTHVAAFAVILGAFVVMASIAFGWEWLPTAALAMIIVSIVMYLRVKVLHRKPTYYEESLHMTTLVIVIFAAIELAVSAFN